MSSGFKYVPDDEETIEDEAPLATTDGEPMWTAKPATIELQVLQPLWSWTRATPQALTPRLARRSASAYFCAVFSSRSPC
jgi:hypothetical protein